MVCCFGSVPAEAMMIMFWARLLFLLGFVFLVGVAGWAVVQITRMKREQAIAIATLNALAARAGLKELIERLQMENRP